MMTKGNFPLNDKQRELAKLVKEPQKFLGKSLRAWSVAFHYPHRPKLENVQVQGDTATGDLVLPDGKRHAITFEKIDGSWRVNLPFWSGAQRDFKSPGGHGAKAQKKKADSK
jgi:hypothetical protein